MDKFFASALRDKSKINTAGPGENLEDLPLSNCRPSTTTPSKKRPLLTENQASVKKSRSMNSDATDEHTKCEFQSSRALVRSSPTREIGMASNNERNIFLTHRPSTRSTTSFNREHVRPGRTESPSAGVGQSESQKWSLVNRLTPWEQPIVYPSTGPKRTTVDFDDIRRLDEGEFLNDNLVSFYLRYMAETAPHLQKSVYFFNTYFYSALTTTPKHKKGFNFEAVQKWTSKVDIFTYDFVVVPINEDVHWYVAIICNLTNINRVCRVEEAEDDTILFSKSPVTPATVTSSEYLVDALKYSDLEGRFPDLHIGENASDKGRLEPNINPGHTDDDDGAEWPPEGENGYGGLRPSSTAEQSPFRMRYPQVDTDEVDSTPKRRNAEE